MGQGEAMQDPAVVIGTFLLNNIYACILFNSGAEQSFMNHKFKYILNQSPQKLNETFRVGMANGKTETTNDVFLGCTLTLNNHLFRINLMLVTIRRFYVFISMDWLSLHHSDIMCCEKAFRLHLPNNKTIII